MILSSRATRSRPFESVERLARSGDQRLHRHREVILSLIQVQQRGAHAWIRKCDRLRRFDRRIASVAERHWRSQDRLDIEAFADAVRTSLTWMTFSQLQLSQIAYEQAGLHRLERALRSNDQEQSIDQILTELHRSASTPHDVFLDDILPVPKFISGRDRRGLEEVSDCTRSTYRRIRLKSIHKGSAAMDAALDYGADRATDSSCDPIVEEAPSLRSLVAPQICTPATRTGARLTIYVLMCYLTACSFYFLAGAPSPTVGVGQLILFIAFLIFAFGAVSSIVEAILGAVIGPRTAATLDYRASGIPESRRAVIAVPVVLGSPKQIDAVVENAVWNLTSAADSNVSLALLTDHRDAPEPDGSATESGLFAHAASRIEALRSSGLKIVLLHRERSQRYEGRLIGWERKRGKLVQLCSLMLDGKSEFTSVIGDIEEVVGSRYVLCLDEDSRISRDCVQRLAGVLAHPENEPRWDADSECFRGGYGLVSPRFITRAESLASWRLAAAFCGPVGSERDVATRTRNFLFDWVGTTQYPGKGMFDARVFMHASSRLPEGCVLSHDTLEGAMLRCAYEGQSVISESFPSSPATLLQRIHRWTRGDIQNYLLFWLRKHANSRNYLRGSTFGFMVNMQARSSAAPAALAVLVAAWSMDVAGAAAALAGAVFLAGFGPLLQTIRRVGLDASGAPLAGRVRVGCLSLVSALLVRLLGCWTQAWVVAAGVAQAAIAVVSGRKLLDWNSAAVAEAVKSSIWSVPGVTLSVVAASAIAVLLMMHGIPWWRVAPVAAWALYPAFIGRAAVRARRSTP